MGTIMFLQGQIHFFYHFFFIFPAEFGGGFFAILFPALEGGFVLGHHLQFLRKAFRRKVMDNHADIIMFDNAFSFNKVGR